MLRSQTYKNIHLNFKSAVMTSYGTTYYQHEKFNKLLIVLQNGKNLIFIMKLKKITKSIEEKRMRIMQGKLTSNKQPLHIKKFHNKKRPCNDNFMQKIDK